MQRERKVKAAEHQRKHTIQKEKRTIGYAKRGERGRRKEKYKQKKTRKEQHVTHTNKNTIQAMLFFFKL